MTIYVLVAGIGGYFVLGVLALGLLDIVTKRIRNRLASATYDVMLDVSAASSPIGRREATILTIGALWLLWPLAVYSAVVSALSSVLRGSKGSGDG